MSAPLRQIDAALNDLFADIQAFHAAHVKPMRERLRTAGATRGHTEDLELAWDRVIRTQQNILLHLQGVPIRDGKPPRFSDYPATTGDPSAVLDANAAHDLTNDELRQMLDACEISRRDCRAAIASLRSRDGSGAADYWLGDDSPSSAFARFEAWFQTAISVLRRLRQQRALTDHRAGTQFPAVREGAVSRSHNVNTAPETHGRFAELTPQERGDLIERALEGLAPPSTAFPRDHDGAAPSSSPEPSRATGG